MFLSDNNKSIDFNIIQYEYPHAIPSKKEFNYDANWLLIKVVFCDENTNKTYTDPCLLTYELSELVNALQQIINDSDNSYISHFMEPYLSICISKVDKFITFSLSFVISTVDKDRTTIEVTAKWTIKEAKDKLKELKNFKGPKKIALYTSFAKSVGYLFVNKKISISTPVYCSVFYYHYKLGIVVVPMLVNS